MKEIILKWLAGLTGLALVAIHLGGSYLALGCLAEPARCPLLTTFDIPLPFSKAFFVKLCEQLLLVGAFLYALLLTFTKVV